MTGFVTMIKRDQDLWFNLAKWSQRPESATLLTIFTLILPIPAIAFLHHFFFSRFLPSIPGEKANIIQGFFPGLVSWRESLYSWLVLILSTLTAIVICTPLLPLFQLNYSQVIAESGQHYSKIKAVFAIIWMISAAAFYQVEYLFKCRLVFGNSVSVETENLNVSVADTVPSNSPQSQVDVTEIPKTEEVVKKKSGFFSLNKKYSKTSRQIFTFVLIPLVGLWLYSFAKLPEFRQSVNANISVQNPSKLTANEAQPKDNYLKAVNQAKRTAKLAKLAQSEDEWRIVVENWNEAIAILKTVPYTSSNYGIAQQKIIQYQIHRDFAQQYAIGSN
ncbi:MAG: hypothetical protein KME28_03325 [Pelatocladus maniniholoensis HA4357-MV3]|uniref:Uncharacterized protein n=1 Tax=Pelatocladus maniniholoensis HA4357-MV3 TaxID=1117104 RepID=A0A9E3H485_9NOST|nr:hypothetical protein [Pelatocladus maniniholoensis HA4357-MV3]